MLSSSQCLRLSNFDSQPSEHHNSWSLARRKGCCFLTDTGLERIVWVKRQKKKNCIGKLLCHLDTYKSMGLDGIHPWALRELVEELAKPLSIIYQQSWLTGEVPDGWRITIVTYILKKGWKGGSWELQACQPDLSAGQDYGAVHPECAHWACEGQPGDHAQPAWVHERQVLLDPTWSPSMTRWPA